MRDAVRTWFLRREPAKTPAGDLPQIRLENGGGATRGRAHLFGQWDSRASFRFAVEHGGYTGTEIAAHLHNKIAFARRARDRDGSAWGRFLNWVGNDDPDYVPVPGSLFSALSRALGADDGLDLAPDAEVGLRLDVAEALLAEMDLILKEMAGA